MAKHRGPPVALRLAGTAVIGPTEGILDPVFLRI